MLTMRFFAVFGGIGRYKGRNMTPEKLFHELLGLGLNWEVSESRFEKETGTVFLEIRETARLWESVRCPKDGGLVFCYDHTEVLTWRHLNVFQHRCEITCRLPRGKCRQCGSCVPGASALGGFEQALHQGV